MVLLLGRAALVAVLWGTASADIIKNDTHFYGQSPAVYPSPPVTDAGTPYLEARELLSRLEIDDKVQLLGGVEHDTACSGFINPIPKIGFPGMCLSDAGNGLRNTDFVNSYPSGISVGASWNKGLARKRGLFMAREFLAKGVNVLLGPVVGPAWRVVRGGRNWEGFSADPYLADSLVAQSVEGIQAQGVQASVKETNRQISDRRLPEHPAPGAEAAGRVEAVFSNIDDKTMHEVYLWPFQDAVKAGCVSIMCSYQRINNSYGCANSKTLNGLLKTELGFQGYVVSDWGAQHAGVASAQAGLDMAMPNGSQYWGKQLVEAVQNETVSEERLDDMATRVLAAWKQLGQGHGVPAPGHGMPKRLDEPHRLVDARTNDALPVLRDGAVEGHVLVKNTKQTLPLVKPKMLSIFGYSAKSPDSYGPGGSTETAAWQVGGQSVTLAELIAHELPMFHTPLPSIGKLGTLVGGCGSGAVTPAVFTAPLEALKARAAREDIALNHDLLSKSPVVAAGSDDCIVVGNAWACEGYDRPGLRDTFTDELIRGVADQCAKTIVVFHNAGVRLVDGFVDHANVTAILFAHLPGRDSGDALVSLLFGDANPSGKLPYTVARKESDYGHVADPDVPRGDFDMFPQSDFTEGVYLDYKHFDRQGVEPRYEFGFGLSYTTFRMDGLRVEVEARAAANGYPSGPVRPGGQSDLWDEVATVEFGILNAGDRSGAEVAQVYVHMPGGPAKQLRGFDKVFLSPGEKTQVRTTLTRRDLSVWDTALQQWKLQRSTYGVYVGNSSRSLPLRQSFRLDAP